MGLKNWFIGPSTQAWIAKRARPPAIHCSTLSMAISMDAGPICISGSARAIIRSQSAWPPPSAGSTG